MCFGGAVEHFLNDIIGAVQKFLDMRTIMTGCIGGRFCTQLLGKLAVDPGYAIRIEDTTACRGIGNQDIDITTRRAARIAGTLSKPPATAIRMSIIRSLSSVIPMVLSSSGPATGCP